MRYEDFFVTVDGTPGSYTVEARGPGEVGAGPAPSPFAQSEALETTLARIAAGRPPAREQVEAVGRTLFDALFPRPIFRALERARSALPEGTELRLKLVVRPAELSHLPWELLYDPEEARFLATLRTSPLARFIPSGRPVASLLARRPVRVLYVQANPEGTKQLHLGASEQAIREALGDDAEIVAVRAATPEALRAALRAEPGFHILHYDGHAEFDETAGAGSLVLHDKDGRQYTLDGERLATYLDGTSVRLVVLAACESGADSRRKRFAGLAQELMRAGRLPATVAMQYAVLDTSVIAFNKGFYQALAADLPLDAAVVEGRLAILELLGGSGTALRQPDWATPVLFMRSQDGAILRPSLSKEDQTMAEEKEDNEKGGVNISGNARVRGNVAGGNQRNINTGGGAYNEGGVNTGGGPYFGGNFEMKGGNFAGGDQYNAGRDQFIAGRDQTIHQGGAPAEPADRDAEVAALREQLAELQAQLAQAITAGEIARPGQARDAQGALEAAQEELQAPEPDGERVVRKLEETRTVLEQAAATIQAAGRAGASVLKLAPLAAAAAQLAQRLFG